MQRQGLYRKEDTHTHVRTYADTIGLPCLLVLHSQTEPTMDQKYEKKIKLNLSGAGNYLHIIYIVLDIIIWRWKWQPTPVFLPRESQVWGSLVDCRLWGRTESDTTEVT